jgi:DNA-directed RNA polymerase subunit omega
MIPADSIDQKFAFVLAAAKRARQLQSGAKPQVNTHSRKPTRIGVDELLAGAVQYELPELEAGEEESEREKKGKKSK